MPVNTANTHLTPQWDIPSHIVAGCTTNTSLHQLPHAIRFCQQVHTTQVIQAEHITPETIADACITDIPSTVCAVRTADCVPLLLCNEAGTQVGAIHAGWRGLLYQIIGSTLQRLMCNGPWSVWIGPSLCQQHTQLNNTIHAAFLHRQPESAPYFSQINGNWHLDLGGLAQSQCYQLGVRRIWRHPLCTYPVENGLCSHRRNPESKQRMISYIYFNTTHKEAL